MADEDAPQCISSSSSSSSSSTSPPKKKRREDERPRRLHHCIWSCPSTSSANGPSASDANGGAEDGDTNHMKKPSDVGKEGFARLVQSKIEELWGAAGRNRLLKLSVWEERHQNGSSHFHCPILMDKPCVSGPLLKALKRERIYTYFTANADYYWSLILYLAVPCASKPDVDTDPFLLANHPPILELLADVPRGANRADKDRCKAYLGKKGVLTEKRTMDHAEFGMYVVKHNLRSTTAVLAHLKRASGEDAKAATNYAYRFSQQLDHRVAFAWQFAEAPSAEQQDSLSAWDFVVRAGEAECQCGERGQFGHLLQSNLVFQSDEFPRFLPEDERPFPAAVRNAFKNALQTGAQKFTNVFIYGPRNTGKSSSLAALETIFTPKYCFTRPVGSASQFVMQGIINKKVAVLQDLRASSLRLSWDSMLVWLEGSPITISQPRNQASEDLVYTGRAPVFISSAEKFRITMQECLKQGLEDPASQNAMLDARFRYFAYTRERPQGQMVHCPPCGPCFSEWLQAKLGFG